MLSIATIGSWIIFKERLGKINYAGILLSFIGVIIFIFKSDGTISLSVKGLLLLMLAVFSAVGYNLTLSKLVGNYSPVFIVNTQNTFGAILFLPLFLIFDFNSFMNTPFTFSMFKQIIELSLFSSCGAFILFAYSVGNLGISKANVFSNSIPVFTAFFSFLLLGDKLTLQNIAGMVIVIAGLFLSQLHSPRKRMDEAAALSGKTA